MTFDGISNSNNVISNYSAYVNLPMMMGNKHLPKDSRLMGKSEIRKS